MLGKGTDPPWKIVLVKIHANVPMLIVQVVRDVLIDDGKASTDREMK
jgi:hypothetical protein